MSDASTAAPAAPTARRFLHCNLNCSDVERSSTFYEDALDLRVVMRSGPDATDGTMFAIPGLMTSRVWFVYDERGPRACSSIELQQWESPASIGEPHAEPWRNGAQALGFFVADVDAAGARIVEHGGSLVGQATIPDVGRVLVARDLDGVTLDIVESDSVGHHAQLRQLRLSCADLPRSIAWYEALGFEVLRAPDRSVWPGAPFALPGDPELSTAVLATPADPGCWLVLTEWHEPASAGTAYAEAYHRGIYRMALSTDDAQAAHAAATGAGLTVTHGPEDVALAGTPIDSMWILFLRDPDGFIVELVERPRSAFRDPLVPAAH